MAINKNGKFGVVYTSPAALDASASSMVDNKLYFAVGATGTSFAQGIYAKTISSDGDEQENVTMLASGALANGTIPGLSQYNFNDEYRNKVDNTATQLSTLSTSVGALPTVAFKTVTVNSTNIIADSATDTLTIAAGSNITLTPDATNNKITIAATNTTYSGTGAISLKDTTISHTSSGVIAGRYGDTGNTRELAFGGTFNVLDASVNTYGHVTAISTKTLTLPSKPSTAGTADNVANTFDVSFNGADILTYNGSTNKTLAFKGGSNISISNSNGTLTFETSNVPTTTEMNTAIQSALSSALQYKGTVVDGSVLPTSNNEVGDVYVASGSYTTTQNNISYICETGDLFIYNGTYFDIVNGENQVTNANATLAWNSSTKIATVDGTDIYVKLPSNPNTDTKVTTSASTSKLFLIGKTDASKATTSAANYNASVYIDGNYLYSGGVKVLTAVPTASTSSIGGIIASNVLSSAVTLTSSDGSTASRYYGVQVDNTGKAFVNIPWTDTNTDTKVTSVGNHYTPTANASSALSADASSATAATWGSTDLVTGVNIQRDAAGHVTGVTVDSIQMPSNPNTDTKNTAGSTNSTSKLFLIGATSQAANPQTYSNANVYINSSNQIVASSGAVASGNTALVTGDTVYTAVAAAQEAATIYWDTL